MFFRLGAMQVILEYGFRKDDPDFIWCLIVIIRTVHRFRYHLVLFSATIDFTLLSPPGALPVVSVCKCRKGQPDLIIVFNGNDTSIIHRSRYSQVFLLAGINVRVFSPLRSAAGEV